MSQDLKDLMPTERKSTWRTAKERRISDLTWVLEWLERRQGKKKHTFQAKDEENAKANEKAEKRGAGKKQERDGRKVAFSKVTPVCSSSSLSFPSLSSHGTQDLTTRVHLPISDLDIKDVIALESNMRPSAFRRQSSVEPVFQDAMFGGRRGELLRDWTSKVADTTYERKLKSLMEKGTEPKIENAKMLKPEEVLSCRYLRLSKNNIRTLIKLCKDAGLNVDIHPHMVEAEIDSKKVFNHHTSVSL
uniref:RIKEN cDNA 4933402J07 gene n=1 Tax=Nannospalax galili TaxID=1026970 RepID=A0A8C6QZG5_NANGA